MPRKEKDRNIKTDNLHGTRILNDCSHCNSILGVDEGLTEKIGGHKINTPPGPEQTGDRGPAVNPSS